MSSLVSNIPRLKRTLSVFESGLDDLVNEYAKVKKSINDCADTVPREVLDDVLSGLDRKFDFSFMQSAIQDVKDKIQTAESELIEKSKIEYAKKDRAWFLKNLNDYTNEILFDHEGLEYLKLRISNFNDFRHNGLEIGCGKGYWYQWLAALSPLYEVDINWSLFPEIAKQFQPLFFQADRMRFVKGTGTDLPDVELGSIDFVFSWNTFNFLPKDTIIEYMKSIWAVMKPGSYAVVGYTNAYIDDQYDMVVNGHWAYNSSDMMTSIIECQGFEPRALYDTNQKGSWIEFSKPGEKIHTIDHPKPGQGYCKKVF